MRQILFRGKRVDNGEWAYGGIITDGEKAYVVTEDDFSWSYTSKLGIYDGIITPAIPETVGQFTGLTDKNGKRIFDGDIVRNEKHYYDGVVCFDRIGNDGGIGLNGFFIKERDAFGEFEEQETDYDTKEKFYECNRCVDLKQLEVIGNIHDNGELLAAERSDNENQ